MRLFGISFYGGLLFSLTDIVQNGITGIEMEHRVMALLVFSPFNFTVLNQLLIFHTPIKKSPGSLCHVVLSTSVVFAFQLLTCYISLF